MTLSKWEKNRRPNEVASEQVAPADETRKSPTRRKWLTIVGTRRIRRLI